MIGDLGYWGAKLYVMGAAGLAGVGCCMLGLVVVHNADDHLLPWAGPMLQQHVRSRWPATRPHKRQLQPMG